MISVIQWVLGALALFAFYIFECFSESEKKESKVCKKVIGVFSLAFLVLTFFVFLEFGITLVIGEICLFIGIGWAIKLFEDWDSYNWQVASGYRNHSFFAPLVLGIVIFAVCGIIHLDNYYGNIKVSEDALADRTIIKIDYINEDTTLIRAGNNYDYFRILEDGSSIPDSIPVVNTKKFDLSEGEEPWIEKIIETRNKINYNINPPQSTGAVVVTTRYELHIPPMSIETLTQKEP